MPDEEKEPVSIDCYFCSAPQMVKKHRVETTMFVKILWHCPKCGSDYWKKYGDEATARDRRRWH
jgi:uncharacterized protein with PIN domain